MLKTILILIAILLSITNNNYARASHHGGETIQYETIKGYATDTYAEVFYSGYSTVIVEGNGATDLDCAVRDMAGNILAEDRKHTDSCLLVFKMYRAGYVSISVYNYGGEDNRYMISMK